MEEEEDADDSDGNGQQGEGRRFLSPCLPAKCQAPDPPTLTWPSNMMSFVVLLIPHAWNKNILNASKARFLFGRRDICGWKTKNS